MRKLITLITAASAIALSSEAQFRLSPADSLRRDSMNQVTQSDYRDMLTQLNITKVRQGANGNDPKAQNAANYDEAKANPYPDLPDPLILKNGQKVTTAKTWWDKRRPEIVEDFDREVYGRTPKNLPKVDWEVIETRPDTVGTFLCTTKTLLGHVDNSLYPSIKVDIQLQITSRNDLIGKTPVILNFGFVRMPGTRPFNFGNGPAQQGPTAEQQVLERGLIYATIAPNSIQADNGAGLTQGIIGLMNKGQHRKPDDWGALKAWAWGADRAIDYFKGDPKTDERRVAIQGHSRYGKAALVTLAYYPRFLTALVSSSGEGGAKLHRRNAGELVENVASSGEYHWMAGNFIKYAADPMKWSDLPVDSHELIAMCAPRPVFISAGQKGDGWVDARGMFMAAVAAGPVYKLLGKNDLGTTEFPPVETTLTNGDIAFRQHTAGHTPMPNWPTFLDFAGRYYGEAIGKLK
jgi:hypothetical protein